jgi:hypothetical protein
VRGFCKFNHGFRGFSRIFCDFFKFLRVFDGFLGENLRIHNIWNWPRMNPPSPKAMAGQARIDTK